MMPEHTAMICVVGTKLLVPSAGLSTNMTPTSVSLSELGHHLPSSYFILCIVYACLCSLEFMPGKQVGMSAECYPDSLLGGLPNIYYYAANNPSEATIAKRRSYANTISCVPGRCTAHRLPSFSRLCL